MSTWEQIGISSYGVEDLTPESRDNLLASRGAAADEPLLLNPEMLGELVNYLPDAEAPDPRSSRYAEVRHALIDGASVYRTADGATVAVLSLPAERFARKRIAAFGEGDLAGISTLGSELDDAAYALSADVPLASARAAEACDRAAAAVQAFLATPRRALCFDLGDFAESVSGVNTLAGLIELLRSLLLAAGRANVALGAATVGGYDLGGVDEAVDLWKAASCPAARSLAENLSRLLSRTEGQEGRAGIEIPPSTAYDTSWIEACSRIGQRALRWAYDESGAALNFAGVVGTVWPGPALYGYDDWEADPVAARELCAALGRDEDPCPPILCGTHEATISEGLAVPVPEELLKGSGRLFVTESVVEPGALFCQAATRRMDKVAQLIRDEQALEGYPWEHADDFEEEFFLYALGDEVEVVDGALPLRELSRTPDWAQPGAEVVLIGAGDHFEVAAAGPQHEAFMEELDIEMSQLFESIMDDT